MNPTLHGQGLSFPPRLDESGRLAWSVGSDNVRESIRVILGTEPGERVMLPSFGAGLGRLLFEPNITSTHRLVEERVVRAMQRWEPRIRIDQVRVEANAEHPQQADITIAYTLVATGEPGQVGVTARLGGRA